MRPMMPTRTLVELAGWLESRLQPEAARMEKLAIAHTVILSAAKDLNRSNG